MIPNTIKEYPNLLSKYYEDKILLLAMSFIFLLWRVADDVAQLCRRSTMPNDLAQCGVMFCKENSVKPSCDESSLFEDALVAFGHQAFW